MKKVVLFILCFVLFFVLMDNEYKDFKEAPKQSKKNISSKRGLLWEKIREVKIK